MGTLGSFLVGAALGALLMVYKVKDRNALSSYTNTGDIHRVPSGCLTKTGDSTIASIPNQHLKISSKQKQEER